MRNLQGAAALVLAATSVVQGQECPPGYQRSGKIDWESCGISKSSLQCGTLEVPRDYTQPSGEKLKLRLVRQPAAPGTKNPKSIIMNPGGPGSSGIKMVVNGGTDYQDIVGNQFNIIGLDPRGVGQSAVYKCPERQDDDGRNAYYSESGIKTALEYNVDQADDCSDPQYKSDLVGTAFVARDIKAVAEAVGEDNMIRFWGFSYGTLLGATVAAMFPTQIDRMILDGNINPTDYYRGIGAETCADLDKGVEAFFKQCADAPNDCAVAEAGKSGAQLQQTFDAFLKKLTLQQSWSVRQQFQETLYFKKEDSFNAYAEKLKGWYKTPSSIKKRALEWDPNFNESAPAYANPMALDAITCGDVVTRLPANEKNYKQWLTDYTKVSRYGGDVAVRGQFQCAAWKVNAAERFMGQFTGGIKTHQPILFVQSTFDPVTPLVSANSSAKAFERARVLVSTGVGHCTNANESPELNKAMKTYMVDGTFPDEVVLYQPKVKNVFKDGGVTKRSIEGPNVSEDVEYPSVFKRLSSKRAISSSIPAGCTPIATSSMPIASASSSVIASRSSSSAAVVSSSAQSSSPASSGTSAAPGSSSAFASRSSSASVVVSSSAAVSSQTGSASVSASASASAGSASSAASVMSSSAPVSSQGASVSGSVSVTMSAASASPSASMSQGPSSAQTSGMISASSQIDVSSASSLPVSSIGSAASSVPASSMQSSGSAPAMSISPSSVKVYGYGGQSSIASSPTSVPYGQGNGYYPNSPNTPSSSLPSYNNGYNNNGGYQASSLPSYNNGYNNNGGYQASSINQGYGSVPVATTTPCPSGYVPVTNTYTTTAVQTITQCRRNEYCPLNSATPTAVITKTLTGTSIYNVPTSTVYVTKVIDVCSTGLTTSTVTITQTCKSGCTARPTGPPTGWTTTVKYCDACATPSTVTVTYCTSCANKPTTVPSVKTTPGSPPQKPASTPAVPSKPASVPVYGSQPAVPVYSKPVVPVGSNSTMIKSTPAVGTPAKSTLSQTTPTGGYGCSGPNCPYTPTTTKSVVQFTGAAMSDFTNVPFVMPAILAGFAFFL